MGIVLDSKIDLCWSKIEKYNKLVRLIRRLSVSVPRKDLRTIYKSFIKPHLDYGDISYLKPKNENFQNKLEKVQYKACIALTGAIKGTSRQKVYDNLGLHSLSKNLWQSKLVFLYKILNGFLPKYFIRTYHSPLKIIILGDQH